MKMSEAVVLWNPKSRHERTPGLPQFKVVSRRDDSRKFNYLAKSMGACWSGWDTSKPVSQATHLLSLFVQATGADGVLAEDAHQEFMQIDEYRRWRERAEGPFAEAYWAWSAPNQTVPQILEGAV